MYKRYTLLFFTILIACVSSKGYALAKSEVIGPTISVEGVRPEVCFFYKTPLQFISRALLANSVVLKKNGRLQMVEPRDVQLAPRTLCFQGLDYRASYQISLPPMHMDQGNRQFLRYAGTFRIPDRKKALGFVRDSNMRSMPHYITSSAPILRSVNVKKARITLYHFLDKTKIWQAWQKYSQNILTSSESLIYARKNGDIVFESDLVLAGRPNTIQKLKTPLPSKDKLLPGLYYLSAMPKGRSDSDLGLFAGQWFLISDLKITASEKSAGFLIETSNGNTNVQIMSGDGRVLKEATSDQKGKLFVPIDKITRQDAAFIMARADNDNIALMDARHLPYKIKTHVKKENIIRSNSQLIADREAIGPDGTAQITVRAKPFVQGHLVVSAVRRKSATWPSYRFGLPVPEAQEMLRDIPFMVGANGNVVLPIKIEAGEGGQNLNAVKVTCVFDSNESFAIMLPIKLARSMIGIKKLSSQSFLLGSQQVRFNLVVLDETGEVWERDDLFYRIVEEGRDFKWEASDGGWNYTLLPRYRRLGGGALSVKADAANQISWGLTPGKYKLEITDAQERVLAQYAFFVRSWRLSQNVTQQVDERLQNAVLKHENLYVPWQLIKKHYKMDQSQDLVQGQSIAISEQSTVVLVSPIIIPKLIPQLESFVQAEPQTVQEIAEWLEASFLWDIHIVELKILNKKDLASLQKMRIIQIKASQKKDGGFSVTADEKDSDLISTAAAVRVLYNASADVIAPEIIIRGAGWLTMALHNNWFEESQRDDRAFAFMALARVKQGDVSALRYFSQMSENKGLSADAMAALSVAFALSGDEENSRKLAKQVQKREDELSFLGKLTLAQNDYVAFDELKNFINLGDVKKAAGYAHQSVVWLSLYAQVSLRAGSWHLDRDGKKEKIFGLFSGAIVEEPLLIKNQSDRVLNYAKLFPAKAQRNKGPFIYLARHFYHLDGTLLEAQEQLRSGQTYLLWMKADRGGADPILRFVFPKQDFYDLIVPRDHAMLLRLFDWLSGPLSATFRHTIYARSSGFFARGVDGKYSIAVLVKMKKGAHVNKVALPLVQLKDTRNLWTRLKKL